MRFKVDENLPRFVAQRLRDAGFDAMREDLDDQVWRPLELLLADHAAASLEDDGESLPSWC